MNAIAGVVRIAHFSLAALATILLVLTAPHVHAERLVNPEGASFNESTPVDDQGLAEIHGTGLITPSVPPRSDVAVILWDEQPKSKPAPVAPNDTGSASQAVNTSIRGR